LAVFQARPLIPADTTARLAEVRLALHREITELKVAQEIQKKLQQLREEARPQVFLRPRQRLNNIAGASPKIVCNEMAAR